MDSNQASTISKTATGRSEAASSPSYKEKLKPGSYDLKPPKTILVYCKAFDDGILPLFLELFNYIVDKYPDTEVYVDRWVIDAVKGSSEKVPTLFQNMDENERRSMDLIITLGGDGTILWASKQFHQWYMPPVVSFALGS